VSLPAARKPKLAARLVSAIQTRIGQGLLVPGDRLETETELAARFAVSRTVVREAIATLAARGLVEARQGAGMFVRRVPLPLDGFQDGLAGPLVTLMNVLELRLAVEAEAAALAAQRRTAGEEAVIRESFAKLEAALAAGTATVEQDAAFHLAIARATHNPFFVECLTALGHHAGPRSLLSRAERDLVPDRAYLVTVQHEHAAILDAIADGDAERARCAMRHHLAASHRRYQHLLQIHAAGKETA
jgi:GntR family transcriptional repressor for pyruvate dehydrogenase complex